MYTCLKIIIALLCSILFVIALPLTMLGIFTYMFIDKALGHSMYWFARNMVSMDKMTYHLLIPRTTKVLLEELASAGANVASLEIASRELLSDKENYYNNRKYLRCDDGYIRIISKIIRDVSQPLEVRKTLHNPKSEFYTWVNRELNTYSIQDLDMEWLYISRRITMADEIAI